jgi:hypothetical protein
MIPILGNGLLKSYAMSDLIGKMDKVCELLQNTPTAQGAGAVDSYAVLLTTRGYLKKSSGSRSLQFADISVNDSWSLIVRKQNQMVNNLRRDMKWRIDNRTFTIDSWEDIEEEHFYYKFYLTEQRA